MEWIHLAKQIKSRRKQLKLTQEELAEIAGVSLRALKQLELGKANPTLRTLFLVGDTMGLRLNFEIRTIDSDAKSDSFI